MKPAALLSAAALAALAAACETDEPLGSSPAYETMLEVLPGSVDAIDLLFVIDDSGSMREEQESLAARAQAALFSILEASPNAPLDLHVAVVSTNVGAGPGISDCEAPGDDGRFLHSGNLLVSCLDQGSFLVDVADGMGGRTRNFQGELGDAFSCMATLGTDGCGFEQPLEAMRRALDGSNPENAGFLREDALLAVVIVSDEDDCSAFDPYVFNTAQDDFEQPLGRLESFRCFEFGVVCDGDQPRVAGEKKGCVSREDSPYMTPVSEYVDFLDGLKPHSGLVVTAAITGDRSPVAVEITDDESGRLAVLEPSCTSANGHAAPAVRLDDFLHGFPGRHVSASICSEDLGLPLMKVAEQMAAVINRSTCLRGNIADLQEGTPGLQADCRVFEATAHDAPQRNYLSACENDDSAACWELVSAPDTCAGTETELALELRNYISTGDSIFVECRQDATAEP